MQTLLLPRSRALHLQIPLKVPPFLASLARHFQVRLTDSHRLLQWGRGSLACAGGAGEDVFPL